MTLEFLSYKILYNFMRNEFRILQKKCSLFCKISYFAKLAIACKNNSLCFVFLETENFTCEMKRYCNFTQYNQCGSISLVENSLKSKRRLLLLEDDYFNLKGMCFLFNKPTLHSFISHTISQFREI